MGCHLEVGNGDLLDGRDELHYSPGGGDDETEKRSTGQLDNQAQEQPLLRCSFCARGGDRWGEEEEEEEAKRE